MYASNFDRYSGVNRLPSLENVNSTPNCGAFSARMFSTKLGWPSFCLMTACSKFALLLKNNTFFVSAADATFHQEQLASIATMQNRIVRRFIVSLLLFAHLRNELARSCEAMGVTFFWIVDCAINSLSFFSHANPSIGSS